MFNPGFPSSHVVVRICEVYAVKLWCVIVRVVLGPDHRRGEKRRGKGPMRVTVDGKPGCRATRSSSDSIERWWAFSLGAELRLTMGHVSMELDTQECELTLPTAMECLQQTAEWYSWSQGQTWMRVLQLSNYGLPAGILKKLNRREPREYNWQIVNFLFLKFLHVMLD